MKLRYQMRGLGIGMIVTALLMGVATREKIPLSDAEIRAKALELGMVESDSLRLTDIQNTPSSSTPGSTQEDGERESVPEDDLGEGGSVSGEGSEAFGENIGSQGQESPEYSEESDGSQGQENSGESQQGMGEAAGEPDNSETDEAGIITFVIESGMDSYSICRMLAQTGLVEDASVFDTYINELGYSRSLRAGTYEIPMGTDEEEIAKIITGNR